MQNNLKKAAEDLKNATSIAAGDNLQFKLIKRLELCAKQAAGAAREARLEQRRLLASSDVHDLFKSSQLKVRY